MNLRPKKIIVVGGGSGIGCAVAQKLLDYGAETVILTGRTMDKLSAARNRLVYSAGQTAACLQFDIADVNSHEKMIEKANINARGGVDGLVISSGVNYNGGNWKGFNITEDDWDRVMDINLKGPFFLIRNFANYCYARNIRANICAVSSISAHRDMLSVYQVTKHSLSAICHAYGKFLCERGIILNCVEPGTTDTPMMPHLEQYTDGFRSGKEWNDNSIRRVIRPEEIAEIICFLMSESGEVLSGSCVLAGGGCKGLHY